MALGSFATAASERAPLEGHSIVSKPSVQLPHTYNSPSPTPPPAYAKECSVPSTIRHLLQGAPSPPCSVGQSSITRSPESDTGMSVVTGGTGAAQDEEEQSDADDCPMNEGNMGQENDVDMGASGGNEHDDSQDAADEGEQSDSMDVDVGVAAEDEHENSPDEATESSPSGKTKLLSLAQQKSIRSGEKRKNPTRAAKTKAKQEPPLPSGRRKPKPRPTPNRAPKSRAQSNLVRNYFEEIERGAISEIVEMIDLTHDIVSHSPP